MNNEETIQRMLRFLRQHADTYSIEALRQQLLVSAAPALVDEALQRLHAERQHDGKRAKTGRVLLLSTAFALANLLVLPIVFFLTVNYLYPVLWLQPFLAVLAVELAIIGPCIVYALHSPLPSSVLFW
jgi:hypothetical protein